MVRKKGKEIKGSTASRGKYTACSTEWYFVKNKLYKCVVYSGISGRIT